jgi:DNA-directed RNA polymerase subunit RPC12/RpoP
MSGPERRQQQRHVEHERRATPKCACPHCGSWESRVREGRPDMRGFKRTRVCAECGKPFVTYEKVA